MDIKKLHKISSELNILYVEDEVEIRTKVVKYLSRLFKNVFSASDGEEALKLYKKNSFDIVVTDILMPKMDGLNLIKQIKQINEKQEFIIISAFSDTNYLIDAINCNVHAYVIKPIDFGQFNQTLYNLCFKITITKENENYKEHLKELVDSKTLEFKNNFEQTIQSLVKLIEMRDTYTAGHSERVALYSKEIAKSMNLPNKDCEFIYQAGILHDIGKINTPDSVLLKPEFLSKVERSLIQKHVVSGHDILKKIPMYKEIAELIIYHHERYDGQGYPSGLKENEIPLLGHIMIVADAFDAMTSNRIYRRTLSIEQAIKEIKLNSAKQFHPEVVSVACDILPKVFKVDKTNDTFTDNILEQQRMAYHFSDPISHSYNLKYLLFLLKQGKIPDQYIYLEVLKIHNLAEYNKKHNWIKGDQVLNDIADEIKLKYPKALLFRIHGSSFALLFEKYVSIDMDYFLSKDIFTDNNLDIKSYNIDLTKYDSLDDVKMEKIFNDDKYI
jgi:putative nucleotidyltransferase with HDIG domain